MQQGELTHLGDAIGDGIQLGQHLLLRGDAYQIGHAERSSGNGLRE